MILVAWGKYHKGGSFNNVGVEEKDVVDTSFYNLHLTNIKGKIVMLHQGHDRNFNS